ncbi:ANTAR domain-containing protein [Streptomyces sp. cg35]|uniref:ANTAR domain-containing protein n=1 Tax=Streptomyces sp. cg35 TaxID=3421650 RepID=UPI003D175CD1
MTPRQTDIAEVFTRVLEQAAADPLDVQGALAVFVESSRWLYGARAALVRYTPLGTTVVWTDGTDSAVRSLAADAAGWGEGPGHDVQSSGCALLDVDVTTHSAWERWPRWAPRAASLGFGRVTVLPLSGDDGLVGAVVLLGAPGSPLDEPALELVRSLAEAAAGMWKLQREVEESRSHASDLQQSLSTRVVVEQAKGILAARHNISLEVAFARLRLRATTGQRTILEAAHDVVEGRQEAVGP